MPRVAGHARLDDQPRWQPYDIGLAHSAPVSGRVIDGTGSRWRTSTCVSAMSRLFPAGNTSRLRSMNSRRTPRAVSGPSGCPAGTASIWVHKPGYYGPGLGHPVKSPKANVEIRMKRAGQRPGHRGIRGEAAGG